jgi:hypothetical protein
MYRSIQKREINVTRSVVRGSRVTHGRLAGHCGTNHSQVWTFEGRASSLPQWTSPRKNRDGSVVLKLGRGQDEAGDQTQAVDGRGSHPSLNVGIFEFTLNHGFIFRGELTL